MVTFAIPTTTAFPSEYRNGIVEIGVWPSLGKLPSVLDREGGLEELKDWTINILLIGFIEGNFDKSSLIEDEIVMRIFSSAGHLLLDTFIWGEHLELEVYNPA